MSHTSHFVICIKNDGCEDLQLRRLYEVLPDDTAGEAGLIRVVDDSGEDYLYPVASFVPVTLPASVEQILAEIPIGAVER